MKIILFGCGQGGQMVRNWIPANHEILCYTDNNPSLWGKEICGLPVVSPAKAAALAPDLIWITLLNQDATLSIETQLRKELSFTGEIRFLKPLRQVMDLRLSHLRLLASEIRGREIPGAVAELGVYRGEFAAEINRLFPSENFTYLTPSRASMIKTWKLRKGNYPGEPFPKGFPRYLRGGSTDAASASGAGHLLSGTFPRILTGETAAVRLRKSGSGSLRTHLAGFVRLLAPDGKGRRDSHSRLQQHPVSWSRNGGAEVLR